jgi:outer membrane protein OmpA-like peptidoglycan-associated protein
MNEFYLMNIFNKNKILVLLGLAMLFGGALFAQDKLVEKANEYYKLNQFADAAGLFEQSLGEMGSKGKSGRSAINLKTKLAYCYRMNNKMDKAEALYAEVVQDESAKPEILYYYGEALMSNGKYEEAKKWLLDYQKLEPNDEKAQLMLEACDKVPFIQPYFQYVDIQEFAYNSTADDNAPMDWKGGILFSSDREQGIKLLKEKSGWTGRDYLDLYFSEKKPDGTFSEPRQFSSKLSEVNKNTGNASITADGSRIFFTRNDNITNKQNTYNLQLFTARAAGENRWKSADKLSFCSPNFNFMHPSVSPDGKWLFFVTNKTGGIGGTDLWVSQRNGEDWGKPENLGPVVNTSANEGFPFIDGEGRLYFCSKGHPGYGGFDIFVSEKDGNGNWKTPQNLGKPFNSSLDDISIYVAPDRHSGMFTSSRNGGDDDIFLFKVLDEPPQAQPIVEEKTIEAPAPVVTETPPAKKSEEPLSEPQKSNSQEVVEVKKQELQPAKASDSPGQVPADEKQKKAEAKEVMMEKPAPPSPFLNKPEFPGQTPEKETQTSLPVVQNPQPSITDPEDPAKQEEVSVEGKAEETQAGKLPTTPETKVVLPSFEDLIKKLEIGQLYVGDHFRLENANFDPNIWQLTPRVAAMLDKLVDILVHFPAIAVEIGAYTETLGSDEENLRLSQNRADMAVDYILREGISKDRLSARGYGETRPLNHCLNGVSCSIEEHLYNQRLEVKILRMAGK